MDLSNKNGQPSMEEILASIRRIIAEEPSSANPVIDLHARHRRTDDHEDSNDFELPSIFRPAAPTPERQPLFGRLTDAIRNASSGSRAEGEGGDTQERYRGALRESGAILAVANGQGGLEAASQPGESERYRGALRDAGGNNSLSSALSSLKLTRGGDVAPLAVEAAAPVPPIVQIAAEAVVAPVPEPAPALAPAPAPVVASAKPEMSASPVEDVRRVMVPFRDLRMSRMGSAPAAAPVAPVSSATAASMLMPEPAAPPAVATPDFPAPPVDPFQASMPPIPAPPQAVDSPLSLDDMHRFAAVMEQPQRPAPSPAAPAAVAAPASGIEDATADLLRPMLRQWLAENMPRMVEKALSIELAQSVKQTTKFNGY